MDIHHARLDIHIQTIVVRSLAIVVLLEGCLLYLFNKEWMAACALPVNNFQLKVQLKLYCKVDAALKWQDARGTWI